VTVGSVNWDWLRRNVSPQFGPVRTRPRPSQELSGMLPSCLMAAACNALWSPNAMPLKPKLLLPMMSLQPSRYT